MTKSLIALIGFVIALLTTFAAAPMASAQSEENKELKQFCRDLVASGEFPGLNLGECMSFNLTPEQGFKAHFCDFLRETGQLEELDISYSECIRNLN